MKKEMEIQQDNIEMLLRLKKDNSELKIVPMVDGELGGDDYAYWMGKWGKAEIDEVYHEDERIYFRSHDEDELGERIFDRLESSNSAWDVPYLEEKTKIELAEIEWEKVIVVKIEMPY